MRKKARRAVGHRVSKMNFATLEPSESGGESRIDGLQRVPHLLLSGFSSPSLFSRSSHTSNHIIMNPGEPIVVDDDDLSTATESQVINEVRRLHGCN